ncbi:MAG: DOMON-like domain-containing protein [Snowella sp.]|nr:DOMON-like domain-containing protein [Snowella sp.]
MTTFSLIPFQPDQTLPQITITGQIERFTSQLSLTWFITGEIDQIAIAAPNPLPTRQDHLWQTTCFEFFLGLTDQPDYWEFNLSPSGHWNCYRFSDYRQGMVTETALKILPFQFDHLPQRLTLQINLDLSGLLSSSSALMAGITTVIQTLDGNLSYWALTHPGPAADFHRRDSFQLDLPTEIQRAK